MGSYRVSCCFTRKSKVTDAGPPSDVKDAYRRYSETGFHMPVEQLRNFILECQGGYCGSSHSGSITVPEVKKIVEQVLHKRHPITSLINKIFTLEDFHHYLFSAELNPPIGSQVHHDMNAPLSHYFIYTGHNSYLTGNELSSSPCSELPIIEDLKRGVRVIELDLWPDSSGDNVNVGRTRTKNVDLLSCFKSIKENAFTASPYPVIITLEDHLTNNILQDKVKETLIETFGDKLYLPDTCNMKELPTPEELKYRILISTKPPDEYLKAEEPEDSIQRKNSCPVYKNLIAIHAGNCIGGLEEALKVEKDKFSLLTLAEQDLERAAERHQQQIVRFTQKNILRIYPKGTTFTSSNYKPLIGWLHGAQMVAFNMQRCARSLWLMHGMFRANGGCGYVKKPNFLMTNEPNNEVFNSKAKLPVKEILKVKIYMGCGWHHDFKKTHYAKVGISGARADEIIRKTKKPKDNLDPVWDDEFTFPLTHPEIALLRIDIHQYDMSEKDDFVGQTCLPVSELRQGIRAVQFYDSKGDPTATRLMRFEHEQ